MRINGYNAQLEFKGDYLAMAKACEACWNTEPTDRSVMVKGANGEYYWTKWWDAIRDTPDCPHCGGTGLAPGDGTTECGFCEDYEAVRLEIERDLG